MAFENILNQNQENLTRVEVPDPNSESGMKVVDLSDVYTESKEIDPIKTSKNSLNPYNGVAEQCPETKTLFPFDEESEEFNELDSVSTKSEDDIDLSQEQFFSQFEEEGKPDFGRFKFEWDNSFNKDAYVVSNDFYLQGYRPNPIHELNATYFQNKYKDFKTIPVVEEDGITFNPELVKHMPRYAHNPEGLMGYTKQVVFNSEGFSQDTIVVWDRSGCVGNCSFCFESQTNRSLNDKDINVRSGEIEIWNSTHTKSRKVPGISYVKFYNKEAKQVEIIPLQVGLFFKDKYEIEKESLDRLVDGTLIRYGIM